MGCRGLVALLALVGLAGCSFTGVVYNRADWLVQREVNQYLPLTDEQTDALRAAVVDWQRWHRRDALPQWQADTLALAVALQSPFNEAQILNWGSKIEGHALAALDQTLVRLVPLMATLEDEQIEAFWVSFDEAREARRDDRGMDADAIFDRADKLMRRWAGRPDAPQRELTRAWAQQRAKRWVAGGETQAAQEEAERREQINTLLTRREVPDALDQWRALLGVESSPRDIDSLEADEQALVSLLAELTASLSPRQRDRLTSRLRRYAAQFGKLAEAG